MLFAACAPKYLTVTPDEFEQAIAEPDVQLVDVRTPEEYEQGHFVRRNPQRLKTERYGQKK